MNHRKAVVSTLLFTGAIALSCWLAVTAVIALIEVVKGML